MSSDDIVDRKQEWWSMDTVQRATYVDDLIAEIEQLRAELELAHTAAIASDEVITQLRATIRGLAAGDWEDDDEQQ